MRRTVFLAAICAACSMALWVSDVSAADGTPVVTISASPTAVNQGDYTTVTWRAPGADSCVAQGAWAGNEPASGTQATPVVLAGTNNFTLVCTNASGTGTGNAVVFANAQAVQFDSTGELTPPGNLLGRSSTTVTMSLPQPQGTYVIVPYSVSGTEPSTSYFVSPSAGEVLIPAGQTKGSITVTVTFPGILQCNHTIVLSIGTPINAIVGSNSTNTVTVANRGPLGVLCPQK